MREKSQGKTAAKRLVWVEGCHRGRDRRLHGHCRAERQPVTPGSRTIQTKINPSSRGATTRRCAWFVTKWSIAGLVSVRKHFESFESFVIQSGDLIREGHHRCGRRRTADVTTAANCDIRVT